jgi:hypothetical protein
MTWLPALPRLGLAILIGITLSKPLELRLFHNAIAVQSAINRDNTVAARRATLTASSPLSTIEAELSNLNSDIATAESHAQRLEAEFRAETDGTGGSLRYGYSEVARVKEAAAIQARQQAMQTRADIEPRIRQFQAERDRIAADLEQEVAEFRAGLTDDFLTQMTALGDLSATSSTVWWVSSFVTMLLIGIEITPVIVKLLSPVGPYDVKLDAMNSVETNEAILQRDATIRALVDRYSHGPHVPGS